MLMCQYLIGSISMLSLFTQDPLTISTMKILSSFSSIRMACWFPINDSIQYKEDYYVLVLFSVLWIELKGKYMLNMHSSFIMNLIWICTELITYVSPNYCFSNKNTQRGLQRESGWELWFFLIGEYCPLMLRNIGVCSSGQHRRVKDSLWHFDK